MSFLSPFEGSDASRCGWPPMSQVAPRTPFAAFLRVARAAGGLATDDVLAAFLPLARCVAGWHATGLVAASLQPEALHFDARGALRMNDEVGVATRANPLEIERLQHPIVSALHVVGRHPAGAQYENPLDRLVIGDPRTLG